jgi:hypothetical protein
MNRKIDASSILVGAAALLLIISLFLDWFGLRNSGGVSAWTIFEVLDLVLLGAAVTALAAAFGRLDSRALLGAALVVAVVVVSQILEPPPAAQELEREVGAWLSLAAAAGLLAGAALVAAQIAVTVDVRKRDRRRRVATVDKRDKAAAEPRGGAASPGGASRGAADASRTAAPASAEERTRVADRFAPKPRAKGGPGAADSAATQPFAADPDDPAR